MVVLQLVYIWLMWVHVTVSLAAFLGMFSLTHQSLPANARFTLKMGLGNAVETALQSLKFYMRASWAQRNGCIGSGRGMGLHTTCRCRGLPRNLWIWETCRWLLCTQEGWEDNGSSHSGHGWPHMPILLDWFVTDAACLKYSQPGGWGNPTVVVGICCPFVARAMMKCVLNVWITHLVALTRWLWGSTSIWLHCFGVRHFFII